MFERSAVRAFCGTSSKDRVNTNIISGQDSWVSSCLENISFFLMESVTSTFRSMQSSKSNFLHIFPHSVFMHVFMLLLIKIGKTNYLHKIPPTMQLSEFSSLVPCVRYS